MSKGPIENPIINSPFVEPTQHFLTSPDGEVAGEAKQEKQAKVATAEHLWTVAVNNWSGLGRCAFLEVTDPWDADHLIRAKLLKRAEIPA